MGGGGGGGAGISYKNLATFNPQMDTVKNSYHS